MNCDYFNGWDANLSIWWLLYPLTIFLLNWNFFHLLFVELFIWWSIKLLSIIWIEGVITKTEKEVRKEQARKELMKEQRKEGKERNNEGRKGERGRREEEEVLLHWENRIYELHWSFSLCSCNTNMKNEVSDGKRKSTMKVTIISKQHLTVILYSNFPSFIKWLFVIDLFKSKCKECSFIEFCACFLSLFITQASPPTFFLF